MTTPRIEHHNMDGQGAREHEVYPMAPDPLYWPAVTGVPCPVEGCEHTVLWYEAGYVPGYRACMARVSDDGFDHATLTHRFLAGGTAEAPTLIRMDQHEED